MADRQTKPSSDPSQGDSVRKRVCKACDRCRLKKSKCSGDSPCSRCRIDNTICVFGARQAAYDKVYPKGYVEKLEQQQTWLVHGLQELYHRTIIDDEGCWPDHQLKPEFNDQLPIHDLLTYLGIIDKAKGERFEESPEALQYSLWRHDGMHIQEPSDSSSTSTQSPVICQLLPSDFTSMCSQGTMSPILPSFNSATQLNSIKHDFELVTETVAIDADISYLRCQEAMCMQSVPNTSTADSVSLGGPIWNGIGLFNEINPFYIESYGDLCLNDSTSPSGFISPMSMEYVQMNDCNDSFDLLNKEDSTDIFLDQETFSWARG